jgi:hypothetical protein
LVLAELKLLIPRKLIAAGEMKPALDLGGAVAKVAAHLGVAANAALRARLAAAEMFHRFPGEQRQDRHGHRRHAAAGIRARFGWAAWAVLHAVQYIE